jgi:serine protease Do
LENKAIVPSFNHFSLIMLHTFKRILSLLCVFVIFFVLVTILKTWQSGGDFRNLVPSFLKVNNAKKTIEKFTPSSKPALDLSDVDIISRLNQEYARLTKAVVPSVVSIDTAGIQMQQQTDLFGRSRVRGYPTLGQGSGVIVSEEGHVITNHHVIAGKQQMRVTLHGGKTYNATLTGEDSLLDIAVLKIDSNEKFKPLKLGNSSQVEVGQLVFAIGNPFGLGETVTQGIISAKERSLSDTQRDLFQTDAAINPGNSGGPLVNLTGEIIGINVAIFSVDKDNPSFQGLGFSIPSNDVQEALEQIIRRGRPIRGYLGVRMKDLDALVRMDLGYDGSLGSAIYIITPGSPAEKAGLKPGDVILKYNNVEITNTDQLITLVQRSEIDVEANIQIWRKGEIIELKTTIRESVSIQSNQGQSQILDAEINLDMLNIIGVRVRNLSGTESRRGFHGVVVTQIIPNSLASGLLEAGDLIIALSNTEITNSKEFYLHLAASAPTQETILHLIRNGQPLRVILPKI